VLSVSGLVKRFPARGGQPPVTAVGGIELHVEEGQLFTVLGPSGCGKTTTLRCIAGLESPDEGEVRVGGRLLFSSRARVSVPASERGLGMVFQSYAIWPHMTVSEHAAFPLRVAPRRERPSRRELQERVAEALAVVRLGHLAARRATDLSGGEQQRLSLARALVRRPPLLLLDEPLSNLDVQLRQEMRYEIQRLQRELGVTCLYVTHDQAEALALSSAVAVMRGGLIEQVGAPDEIYERPASPFVAGFIGAANLIEGVVEGGSAPGVADIRTSAGRLRAWLSDGFGHGSSVTVVARPEQLWLDTSPAGISAANGWRGRISARAFLGEVVEHVVEVGELELRVRSAPAESVEPGATVVLGFPEEPLLLVPRE
jgi:iron(III) transport system ATP-binding protein